MIVPFFAGVATGVALGIGYVLVAVGIRLALPDISTFAAGIWPLSMPIYIAIVAREAWRARVEGETPDV